jgi:hypothetical protein
LRQTSIEVPGGTAFGLSVGNFFCGAVTRGAIALNWSQTHPVPFVALVLLALTGLLVAVARTTWRPPDPHPLRRRRQGGQIFRATGRVYARNIPIFAAAGVIFVPVYVLAASIQWVVFHISRASHRWRRTFGFTALVDTLAILSGPLLGVGLLLLTDHSLNFINLAAALVYTFTVPYAAIQLTLYYFDLEARGAANAKTNAGLPDRSPSVPEAY